MKRCIIGIDIGTQGTKTNIYDLEANVLGSAFEASNLINPVPGVFEQDPEEIYQSVINTVKTALSMTGGECSVEVIGIDSQMSGILGINNKWESVTPYDSWLDTRCEKYIRLMKTASEEFIIKTTGCPPTYHHGPKILWWKNEKNDTYKKIEKFVIPSTYVVGRLVGLCSDEAYIDYTNIHFSGFADTLNMCWSKELLSMFDVEASKMPKIVEPWKVIGSLSLAESLKMGLKSGIPIVAGCGDQAATSLGAGVVRSGIAFDVAGTASVFSICVDSYKPDVENKTLISARSVIKDLWVPLAFINGGGLCLKWFRDQLTCEHSNVDYGVLDVEASNIEVGSGNLIFYPHFGGRVCPNEPGVRGAWLGLNWGHSRGHMFRSIMESIAFEYNLYLGIVNKLYRGFELSKVIAIGGGSRSRVFNRIKADCLGVSYAVLENADTATLGSAIVAGYGTGIFDNLVDTAELFARVEKIESHNKTVNKEYQKHYKAYRTMSGEMQKIYNKMESLSL